MSMTEYAPTDFHLDAYLTADSVQQSEQHFADLVTGYVAPLVMSIIRHRMRAHLNAHCGWQSSEIDDIHSAALIKIIRRLRELKAAPGECAPEDFRGYVSTVAINTCNEFFRLKYPERSKLRFSLRYLLRHRAEFALWKSAERTWLCGFRRWCDMEWAGRPPGGEELLEKVRRAGAGGGRDNRAPVQTVSLVFTAAEEPVSFNLLVGVVAALWQVRDSTFTSYDNTPLLYDALADASANPLVALEQRYSLKRLWEEVCQLPLRQRTALLLNLRDAQSRNVLTLLPVTRIVTIRQISQVLEISPEELAVIWNSLPLDDNTIAARMGLTRQQVIKLRRVARERLHRRLETAPRRAAQRSP
jgi:hypothetical protein